MGDQIKVYNSVQSPFFMESIEDGMNLETARYTGRGEKRYAVARRLMVRSCHDALVETANTEEQRGILLIRRIAEPANGYLWSLGGFFDKGVSTHPSLTSRIKAESGLEVDESTYRILGHARMMWKTTPNPELDVEGSTLPRGIDDTGLLFYVNSNGGQLNLDRLHDRPLIVTPSMYNKELRDNLHPYIQEGMDRAISIIASR